MQFHVRCYPQRQPEQVRFPQLVLLCPRQFQCPHRTLAMFHSKILFPEPPEGLAEVRGKGFLNETSQAFGADIGTAAGKVKQVAEIGLAPVGVADSTGRGTAYFATRSHFENAIKLYNEGKISWNKAEKMLDLDCMSPIEANRVRAALKAGDMELAFNEMARSVIDETNFPYRRGSSARITYGGGGNIATFLYKWNIEFLHTTGRWIRTGQWDKVFRYYTASSVT